MLTGGIILEVHQSTVSIASIEEQAFILLSFPLYHFIDVIA